MTDKKTPFYDIHKNVGAKIIPFAGYLMPVMYDSINAEHLRVRNSVGMFDITHMGEFEVTGTKAKDFVQSIATNDVNKLVENQVLYTCMCNEAGGIIDDLLVYNLKDKILLVVNASNIAKDYAHIQKYLPADVELNDVSDQTALIAIQGPKSDDVLSKMTDYPIADLKYYHAAYVSLVGEKVLLSKTGYTGENGYELYISYDKAVKIWETASDLVKQFGGGPIGLGARDSLRLEMKFALYGNDISEQTNPIEAGLGWVVKLDTDDFIGRDAITEIKKQGIKRKLIGFEVEGKVFPRQHYPITLNGAKIGEVTSGIFSPSLKKGIGMGYVPKEYAKAGSQFDIEVRGKKQLAVVVKTPFYKK
ncbi:MAG: glycine cleavage system aminomethyltransferase GcvT [candidate division Zixibacteria bacterium]|nr:glycine cleavage system aminomethyltransferase GcvT [candidate division Zixibacteria bacterium]